MMKKWFVLLVAALMLFTVCACSTNSEPAAKPDNNSEVSTPAKNEQAAPEDTYGAVFGSKKGEKLTILMIPKLIGIPFYEQGERGAQAAAADFNCEIIYDGPTDADAVAQVTIIEDYISKGGIDVICVAPNDPDTLAPVLQKAREQGIMTMFFDSMANEEDVDCGVTACQVETIGKAYMDTLVKYMGDSGDYVLLTGGLNAQNLNEWMNAGWAYADEKYPNLNLVTEKIATEEQQQIAYEKTLEVLQAYPDLKGIISYATPTPLGAAQAIREMGMTGKIVHIGMGTPQSVAEYLKDGSLTENIIWDCGRMCYANVFLARMFFDGIEVYDGIDPAEYSVSKGKGEIQETIGKLEINPGANGTKNWLVTMGEPLFVTAENVDNYNW